MRPTLLALRWTFLLSLSACASERAGAPGRAEGDASSFDAARDAGTTFDAPGDMGAMDAGTVTIDAGVDVDAFDSGARADALFFPPGLDPDTEPGPDCAPGERAACTFTCETGGTAMGHRVCISSGRWSLCMRPFEYCEGDVDDDLDGTIDEGCALPGGCLWLRVPCHEGVTINEMCATHGKTVRAGRRCPAAGNEIVTLDRDYGEFPVTCCGHAGTCAPTCVDPICPTHVVWYAVQCCGPDQADAGVDAGVDAGHDAGRYDAGVDAESPF